MMLAMRKHMKKLSIFLWLVIAAFIGTIFVVWGTGKQGLEGRSGDAIATVNGDEIGREEYIDAMRRYSEYYREIYKDRMTQEILDSLDIENRALQELIQRRLMMQEATRQGIVVTDAEVTAEIEKTKAFQDENGNFSPSRYMKILSMNRIPPERYEYSIRQRQKVDRLRNLVTSSVRVTDEEVKQQYLEKSEKVKCKYVEFRGRDLGRKLKPSDADLKKLYESQKENYKSEREVNVEYLVFEPSAFKASVEVTENEMLDYYDAHVKDYKKEEEVRASHILVKVPDGATKKLDDEAKKKIEGLLERVKAGEDFAKLAKENSDCPSASKGGDLGFFGRGQMAKPFERAAFALKEGEISDVVKTQFGYHIIKLEERKPPETKEFEAVSAEVKSKLVDEKALELAKQAAEKAREKVEKTSDLAALAKAENMQLKTTGFFKRSDKIEGLGRSYQFANAALGLAKGAISPAVKGRDEYYLIKMLDEKTPIVMPFEDAKTKVKRDWVKNEGEKIAKRKSAQFAKQVKDLKSFDAIAKKFSYEVKETEQFGKKGYIRGIGRSEELIEAAFAAKVGDVGGPIKVRDRYVVYGVLEHTTFNEAEFQKDKWQTIEKIRSKRESELLTAWLNDLKEKAEIKIDPSIAKKGRSPKGAAPTR
ncbi:peptidylprolyl isomerase [bacterium]|nr:peptidylprolyl isomerase [bacterium]